MKGILKGFCKLILSLFSILLVILLLVGTWFGIKGYQMYRDAVEEVPISEKAASIRSAPGFTEYEDLPTLYVWRTSGFGAIMGWIIWPLPGLLGTMCALCFLWKGAAPSPSS